MRTLLVALALAVALPAQAGSPIKDDEEVLVFPTIARRDGGDWVVPVHGWIFEPEHGSVWRAALVRTLLDRLQLSRQQAEATLFDERIRWFLVDDERGKELTARAAGRRGQMARSGVDGHFTGELRVAGGAAGSWLTVEIEGRERDLRRFAGRVLLLEDEGLSVVSDIDDTVRVTHATERRAAVESTLLRPFRPVDGMAELLSSFAARGAAVHYVSASPWQLYVPLRDFLAASGFPDGTLHLRRFRALERASWKALLGSPGGHKRATIGALLARFPGRRFVLVGDSGQEDPEIYGELARQHPGRIAGIYIRRVPGLALDEGRQRRAFRGVRAPVHVFDRPGDLPPSAR